MPKPIFLNIDGMGKPLRVGDIVAVCTGFKFFPLATVKRVMGTVSIVVMKTDGREIYVENSFLIKE